MLLPINLDAIPGKQDGLSESDSLRMHFQLVQTLTQCLESISVILGCDRDCDPRSMQ